MKNLLIGKTIRLSSKPNSVSDAQGLDFRILDKVNATHFGNAGDDVFVVESVKTGQLCSLTLSNITGSKILPDGEQA